MIDIPSPETLASLVTDATVNMWGVNMTLIEDSGVATAPTASLPHSRAVVLEVSGAPTLSIVVSADETGGAALGSMMFSCDKSAVSTGMIDDSLCELANILAGQIKTLMAPTHKLGLPTVVSARERVHGSELSQATLRIGEGEETVCVTVAAA
jgi:chemotaxis protein CheY-P-specific phosphatase CheC